jgi:hypothetical protein
MRTCWTRCRSGARSWAASITRLASSDRYGAVNALLGDEQFADIFKARKFDFIDGLELFAYLYAEVTKSRVDEGFRANLAKYLPDVDWDAAEASE